MFLIGLDTTGQCKYEGKCHRCGIHYITRGYAFTEEGSTYLGTTIDSDSELKVVLRKTSYT